jgi:hypothetical protein
MGCSCCTSSIADGTITQTEHDAKVYNLQCRFKDYVATVTDKWRYGIFCPEDSDTLVELRGLLRLLICYGKETAEITDDSQVPECYNNYVTFGGTDLTPLLTVPTTTVVGDYFLITSSNTGNYYILKVTEWQYSGDPLPYSDLTTLLFGLDTSDQSIFQFGSANPNTPSGSSYYVLELLCSGLQSDLDNALQAAAGVTVTSSGLSDANLLLITEKIEKLLAC